MGPLISGLEGCKIVETVGSEALNPERYDGKFSWIHGSWPRRGDLRGAVYLFLRLAIVVR